MSGDQTLSPTPSDGLSLEDLRRDIDHIDDQILDLIMRRAAVVERIGAAKRADAASSVVNFLRPGREMNILRRLLSRVSGPFPKPVIVRMWREMLSATIALQAPMTVAVYMPKRGAGYLEAAREQYGSFTPVKTFTTAGAVVRAVAAGEANLGVLPLPQFDDAQRWWAMLLSQTSDTPRIIARLPICGPGGGRGGAVEAVAIARLPVEETGSDRTYIGVESGADVSRAAMRAAVETAGLTVHEVQDSHETSSESRLHLVEISEYISADDRRMTLLAADSQIDRATIIGGYAIPFDAEELAGPRIP